MCSHSAGLVSAAARAAVLVKAPRRSTSAVAAAPVSALVGVHAKAATQPRSAGDRAGAQRGTERSDDDGVAGNPAAMLQALRAARASQRRSKEERRRAAKATASAAVADRRARTPATLKSGRWILEQCEVEAGSSHGKIPVESHGKMAVQFRLADVRQRRV